ncbi:MAG: GNAT family N-acetyltransferase [Bacteroidota bacterium]
MVSIELLDRYNWEACLTIQLTPEQDRFVPSVLYSLAQARFENLTPYGIRLDGKMVGMLMYGQFSAGLCWINRILVDREHQGLGIGQKAMEQLLFQLRRKRQCAEIRTSYVPENLAAAHFFAKLGFRPVESPLEDEVVVQLLSR